jgi:hypothetical protein
VRPSLVNLAEYGLTASPASAGPRSPGVSAMATSTQILGQDSAVECGRLNFADLLTSPA